ncbi:MAG TPA: thioredoxin family protein [Candidatus Scatovivens faecipullorum]|nr:thioredoxin family protein [Candidatus Scatovivens faecipullorum]
MNISIKSLIIILLILVIIITIWFYKNSEKKNSKEAIVGNNVNQNSQEFENAVNNSVNNEISLQNENIENTVLEDNNIETQNSVNNNLTSEKDFELEADESFDLEKLKSYKLPIILDFGADYCAPCREMKPILKKLNEELRGKAIIKVCDVMEYPELCEGYDVSLIPTQIFINSDGTAFTPKNYGELGLNLVKDKNGKHIYTSHVGYLSEEDLKNIIKEMK